MLVKGCLTLLSGFDTIEAEWRDFPMKLTKKQEKMRAVADALALVYPDAVCALHWEGEPWKLLIMGCLSAQCTDARVNLVAKELFAVYPRPRDLADADLSDLSAAPRLSAASGKKVFCLCPHLSLLCAGLHLSFPHYGLWADA